MSGMDDDSRVESGTRFEPGVMAAIPEIPFEDLRRIGIRNDTPLPFVSPPLPSLYRVASAPSPQP